MVALRNDYITKSTRPSRFSACNIEKTGKGLGTRLDLGTRLEANLQLPHKIVRELRRELDMRINFKQGDDCIKACSENN